MATGSKMAAFIAFSMFLMRVIPLGDPKIVTILAVLGVVSMYFGNIVAVQQKNIKRMLAYSSIAHTGYMLLGLSAGQAGYMAVIFYMFVYTLMTVGAFGVISMVETRDEDAELSHWRGLGMRKPWVAAAMSTFMFALAGMPPLAGFMGKYMIFGAAVQEQLYLPAILGILSSVIGAYYYLRVIVVMYFQKTEDMASAEQTSSALAPLAGAMLLCVLLIILGMFPSLVHSYLDNLYSAAGFMTSIQR
jgi:NADH-quinone oxidoreductase subunit N